MKYSSSIATPKLNPPTEHWKADLKEPSEFIERNRPCPTGRINYVNDVYLEISTGDQTSFKSLLLFGLGMPFLFLWGILELCLSSWSIMGAALLICIALIYPLVMIVILGTYRDTPIRFNRKRQKVYMSVGLPALKPISEAIIEDWQNMRAELSERFERKSFSKKGILHKRIDISVVASGSNQVAFRAPLFTDGDDHETVWEYIRCYMQGSLDELPQYDNPDKANALIGMQRLDFWVAPVVWPKGVDQESRTSGDFGSPFEQLAVLTSLSDVVFWPLFVRYSVVVLPVVILLYVFYRLLMGYLN